MSIKAIILANNKGILGQYIRSDAINYFIPTLLSNIDYSRDDDKIIERSSKTQNFNIHYKIYNNIVLVIVYDDMSHAMVKEMLDSLIGSYNSGIIYNKNKKIIAKVFEDITYKYEVTLVDQVDNVLKKIDKVSNIMKENIHSLNNCSEDTEHVIMNTEKLEAKTKDFEKAAKEARCKVCIDLLMCCGILKCCFNCIRCK